METQELLMKLKQLKPTLMDQFHVREIRCFGSFIRNEQNPMSDVDLLIDFDDNADLIDFVSLSDFLEAHFHKSIDVVPKKALRKELRDKVLKEAMII